MSLVIDNFLCKACSNKNCSEHVAEKIATEKKLTLILNKEVAFFYAPSLDVTSEVITQMDQNFEETQSKNEAPKEEAKPKEATK